MEKTNEKSYDFISNIAMGKKEYKDFYNASYLRLSRIFLLLFILIIIFFISFIYEIFIHYTIQISMIKTMAFYLMIMAVLFLITEYKIFKSNKVRVLSIGKESTNLQAYFSDKIIVESDVNKPREYHYNDIISIKETNLFYLLGLRCKLYIIISKDIKSNLQNTDFINYIFNKCPNIKSKKTTNTKNKKKLCAIYMCSTALLLLISLIILFTI